MSTCTYICTGCYTLLWFSFFKYKYCFFLQENFASVSGPTNQPMDDSFSDMDSPRIRIHINTDGTNGVPYIFLRRRLNTNMRLRIQPGASSDNKPIRIVYRNNNDVPDFTGMESLERKQGTDSRQPISADSRSNLRRIILSTRGASRIRFSPRNF